MNENTNPSKRREWVKNAAIVFLSIMLVLTFFSNTIMNYSLPEVATEYVQSGTITEKVRGTGNITATDPYNVTIEESRIISSVAVKSGDEVKKGDVLFYLEDEESTELLDAEKELNSLILAYQLAVITESMEVGTVSNIENDNTLSLTQKQQKLQNAMVAVDAAQAEYDNATLQVASVNKELGYIGNQVIDTTNEKNAVSNAQKEANNASQSVANAQAEVNKASISVEAATRDLENAKALATDIQTAKSNLDAAKGVLDELQTKYANDILNADKAVEEAKIAFKNAEEHYISMENSYNAAKAEYDSWMEANKDTATIDDIAAKSEMFETVSTSYNKAKAAREAAETNQTAAQENRDKLDKDLESAQRAYESALENYNNLGGDSVYNNAAMNIENANAALDNARSNLDSKNQEKADREQDKNAKDAAVTNAQQALADKEGSSDNSVAKANASNQLLDAQDRQAKAQTALDKAKEELAEIQKELLAEINLESQNEAIELQMEKIEKLKEKSVGATIDAPVDGIVMSLDKVAGDKTEPSETIAVIQVAGKGFTLSFSATTEQARKLSVGDIAELQNAWYYDNVKATLASIKPDPDDPAQKKLLTFNVEGDVQAGQSLSLSVGQKSAEYELVVPNSAVREDNNGKFILIVESKSSPLGNRYIATRVDVEVLASDDTHTAISAGLYGYEYVITTATKPVEAGKQVRLTD